MTKEKTAPRYDNESIRKLSDREAVRLRPAQYAGGSDIHGAFTTVREIISNAIDEFKARQVALASGELEGKGFNANSGTTISVDYSKDNIVTVTDGGRGVPMAWSNKEGCYNFELIYCQLNAGGKYSKEEDNIGYDYAIGLNGVGSALTVLSSDVASVTSVRDDKEYFIEFDSGEPTGELKEIPAKGKEFGTTVSWRPSLEVFDDNRFEKQWFLDYIKQQAIVNQGLTLTLKYKDDEEISYYYENGIKDYLEELNETGFTVPRHIVTGDFLGADRADRKEYRSKYEFVYGFNNENPLMESYHNSSYLKNGGSPHDAIKSAFVFAIDKHIKLLSMYNKSEKKITFDDVSDSLIVITNTYSTETSYENQTKFAITNKFIRTKMNELLREDLEIYFTEFSKEAEQICKQVLANKRSREKAEKTRLDVRKKLSGDVGSLSSNNIKDFKNCSSKDKDKNILVICEGKSALSAILNGRTEYHAVYPIRGKILNVSKAKPEDILDNKEINELFRIMGCGVAMGKKGSKTHTFDISKMNFSKVAFYVDADEDGMGSIFPLLVNMFWELAPELLEKGYLYLGVTPKYELTTIDETHYAMNDEELLVKQEELKGKKYEMHYIKGLAELSSEGMAMSLSLQKENLLRLMLEDKEKSIGFLNTYMNEDVAPRKKLILESFENEGGEFNWRI